MANLTAVVAQLHQQRKELDNELSRLDQAIRVLSGLDGASKGRAGKRRLSAAARARIAAAQRARWAKWKKVKTSA